MLGAEHVLVPTDHVPGIVRFPHGLGNVTGDRVVRMILRVAQVIGAVLQAVDEVIDAGINVVNPVGVLIAAVQVGNAVQIIPLHVVDDAEGVPVARRVILDAAGRVPVGCRVIGLRPGGQGAAKEDAGRPAN